MSHLTDQKLWSYQWTFLACTLFSHFRPRDATLGYRFFQMWSFARANVRITCEEIEEKFP